MRKKTVISEVVKPVYRSFDSLIAEATTTVEQELALEDTGWIKLGGIAGTVLSTDQRTNYLKQSRVYYALDPLAHQSIRLWTDYTFGSGMTFKAKYPETQKVLDSFWNSPDNQSLLGARGQRKSCDKVLIDGEIFFALFLGPKGTATLRTIDPLEITEIITDVEDSEKVLYYKRSWTDTQGVSHVDYYRSFRNIKGEPGKDYQRETVTKTQEALVYHLPYNSIEQRGSPLLLPALDWVKQYRRFLASRVAIMLALAKFAWKVKVTGGASTVAAVKSVYQDQSPASGSMAVENQGVDLQPIKVDTGANQAYQDGRLLKLQVCAAVSIPEQYFGDISIGNLATAQTVELPMIKMFQSYQQIWADTYKDIDEMVLTHNRVSPDKWYVDRDFPAISPESVLSIAQALSQLIIALPELSSIDDVKQQVLIALGINDPAEVLKKLSTETESNVILKLTQALREFKEVLKIYGNGQNNNLQEMSRARVR